MALPGMTGNVSRGLAVEASSLADLNRQARTAPDKALRAAATQFEALFLQNLMKSMRAAMPQDGPLDSEESHTYTEMLDAQVAQTLAKKGTGIADMLVKQLSHAIGGTATPGDKAALTMPGTPAALRMPQSLVGQKALAVPASAGNGGTPSPSVAPNRTPSASSPSAAAAAPGGASAAIAGALTTAGQFIEKMRPYAEMAAQAMGVPAHYLVAQAGLETGWGRSQPRGADGTPSNNLFGIKAGKNWNGAVVEAATTEYVAGKPVRTVERFRAYASPAEAFQDFAALLARGGRYAATLASGTAEGYATQMQKAGYATDPAYADKLARTIRTVARHVDDARPTVTAQVKPAAADKLSTTG
jgi:flagellar protein FlgJ